MLWLWLMLWAVALGYYYGLFKSKIRSVRLLTATAGVCRTNYPGSMKNSLVSAILGLHYCQFSASAPDCS
jgi:hypothetical protein